MRVTTVRIRMTHPEILQRDNVEAFCTAIIDDALAVRDIKIIRGKKGAFMAMPSRKKTERCKNCGCKNRFCAKFCGECGDNLPFVTLTDDESPYADVVFPVSSAARKILEDAIMDSYRQERSLIDADYGYEWHDYDYPVPEVAL